MKQILVCIVTLLCMSLHAQPYYITHLNVEQGLSNNNVLGMTQDKEGFLWFATEEGLNRFDGNRFITYYKYMNRLSGDELNKVYADPDAPVIWIATQRSGMNAYNYKEDKLTVYVHDPANPRSLITNDVTNVSPAEDGNLWLSTYYKGVEHFNTQTQEFTHYNTSTLPGLPSNGTWTAVDDHNGHLFIGHLDHGVSMVSLKNRHVRNFRYNPSDPGSIPSDHVFCLYKDKNKNIWIGTDKGLALYKADMESFIRLPVTSSVFGICHTDDNKLWIATETGVYIIDLASHLLFPAEQMRVEKITVGYNNYSLSNQSARCVLQDAYHNMWIGTYGGGVNFVSSASPLFNTYTYSPLSEDVRSLNNRIALSLCTDAADRVWIGTDGGGVNVFTAGKRTGVFDEINKDLRLGTVLSLFKDSRNTIWVGTFAASVLCYDDATGKMRPVPLGHSSEKDVRCFYEDKKQNLWIGNSSGIFVVDIRTQKVLRHYNVWNSPLPINLVRSIVEDSQGRMWIGTYGEGLSVMSAGMDSLALLNEEKGFCSNRINHVFRDSHDNIWVATTDGLVCFPFGNTSQYKAFKREDGISNTYIRAITEDRKGNIWFSTNAGISCYMVFQKKFLNYNRIHKIPLGNFSNGAVTQDAEGFIYFGSTHGTLCFNPENVFAPRKVAPVMITELKTYDWKSVRKESENFNFYGDGEQKVELNHLQSTFNIAFNVQDFSQATQVEYMYRLKGLDDSWQVVEENNVTFRNIPPGKYEFQVKAGMPNQNWPDAVATLSIHIAPPFWMSWWAKSLYFILAGFILSFLFYFYKKKVDMQGSYEMEKKNHEQEQELNQERLRFYTNITHELRTPLTLILGPLEDLEKDKGLQPVQARKISVIHHSALRLLNLINQILEFRKTETQNKKLCVSKENLASVVKETVLKYRELNTNPEIELCLRIETDPLTLYFDKEVVIMVLDNLISNAMKYTDKGKVEILLYSTRKNETEYVEIKVSDTGQGIAKEELPRIFDRYYQVKNGHQASGTGIGLSLVKNLVNLHEGEIHVESTPGQGTTFCFSLLLHTIYPNALHADPEYSEEKIPDEKDEDMVEDTQSGKPLLLLVEDNPDIREYIKDSFCDRFEILTASEGESATQIAFTRTPDIIVSDIMMPGMDGLAFCKIMKEDVRTSHIPVIMLTAKDSHQNKEEGYLAGADSYLTKPFSASLLGSRIMNLLESRRKLARQYSENLNASAKSRQLQSSLNELDNDFMQRVDQIIEEDLESEKMDITYLADKLCMSRSTLYRKMKALTGISMNEYIRKIKMKNAEQLLLEGKYTISEVAFRVGMSSPTYFRQCFKESFGVSPSKYLSTLRKDSKDHIG